MGLVRRLLIATLLTLVPIVGPSRRVHGGPATAASGIYSQIIPRYMSGEWDQLMTELAANSKEIAALPPAQKADVDYIRRAVAECRPTWWKTCKAGQKAKFRPSVWGQSIPTTFDPEQKNNVHMDYVNSAPFATVAWRAADMDNPAVAGEQEFTKAEHIDVELWSDLGIAEAWAAIPPRPQLAMDEEARQQLSRYLDFRGNVTGAYYATPRARRWAIWLSISGWSDEYAKISTVMSRKAVGILFAAEVLGHPQTYPSIRLARQPPAQAAESKIVWALQEWVGHHELNFAEDQALREALKSFARANQAKVRQTGKLLLPNGLLLSLDPVADKPLAVGRDAWIKAQLEKPRPGP